MSSFFLKYRKIFFLATLLLVSLTLYAVGIEKKKENNVFDRLVLSIFRPPFKITTLCITKANRLWNGYFYLVSLKEQNRRLAERVKQLQLESQLLTEQAEENKRLRKLLSFKEKHTYTVVPAEIIGRDPSSWFKTILINKGQTDGIMPGFGVITPSGVVGRVINVSRNTAKILLIVDVNSSFDALVKRTRARGIVDGFAENRCRLSYVLKTEDIRIGDVVVTSGLHKKVPGGVDLGKVVNIIKDQKGFFQHIEIEPAVDFSKLNEVLVAVGNRN